MIVGNESIKELKERRTVLFKKLGECKLHYLLQSLDETYNELDRIEARIEELSSQKKTSRRSI